MGITAYVGFGSNLGDRRARFEAACREIEKLRSTRVPAVSRLFETEPVGLSDEGPMFLNAVIALDTDLAAQDLMTELKRIELLLGKSADHKSHLSRQIDLDLLLYGQEHMVEDGLEIPHPRMHERAFVLAPLAEIASHVLHPVLGCTVQSLLGKLSQPVIAGVSVVPE
jgi:2-amino-4-hydroxy-6-hydroxymethyldihydropteridine diphosphokinase